MFNLKNNTKIDNFNDFIIFTNQQLSDSINCKITNIKLSFTYTLLNVIIEFDEKICLVYTKRYTLIVKFGNFTYTFLGKNKKHLNITGIKSFLDIEKAITDLTIFSNLELCNFKCFSIDNISSTFKTYSGLKRIIQNITDEEFKILIPQHFPGIVIKYNKCSLTYFNSGSVILVGLKNAHDLNLSVIKYKSFFDYCSTIENTENVL